MKWSFSYSSLVKSHGKKYDSHNMTFLYPNLCNNKLCFKDTFATSKILVLILNVFVLLLYVPSQQLWSQQDGQFT